MSDKALVGDGPWPEYPAFSESCSDVENSNPTDYQRKEDLCVI